MDEPSSLEDPVQDCRCQTGVVYELRARLHKMNDDQLIRFGKAARSMCRDKSPRQVFVIQWRRLETVKK